ncbi:hypothetical protein [Tengunoibacter tsumagoiensis]|uniref:Cyclic nucleotide-binding domain-containing protein n=1 Tax=Tengunoibacter tsumagoiensis TaxID=2014871 RepID=A0A402A9D5_9CHLR|nr:hypothetical protein [Tengunoibacter tsumagoiensis]GCE15772.1 hypothetical protein KTT_56310 [Tengunoibacter tsumagoiensis]
MITLDTVAQIPLCSHMAEELQIQIANRAADVRLQAGEWLIQEGELPLFFVLVAGSLDVIKHLGNVEQVNCLHPSISCQLTADPLSLLLNVASFEDIEVDKAIVYRFIHT